MKLDRAGYEFIKSFEGLSLTPYLDGAAIWTIGYGHTDGVDQYTPKIDEKTAQVLLEDDVEPCEKAVERLVSILLEQYEFNALVSFAFNLGIGALKKATLLSKLNNGDKRGAAKEFDKWIYLSDPKTGEMVRSNGLVARRAREKLLFLTGSLTV